MTGAPFGRRVLEYDMPLLLGEFPFLLIETVSEESGRNSDVETGKIISTKISQV